MTLNTLISGAYKHGETVAVELLENATTGKWFLPVLWPSAAAIKKKQKEDCMAKTRFGLIVAATALLVSSAAYSQSTPIKHVVFIIKENRSFDHMFGTLPGVNGATRGKVRNGRQIPLAHAKDQTPNFGHTWGDAQAAIDGGRMDNFTAERLCSSQGCYSQYTCSDIPDYCSYATNYLLADDFFSSESGPSYPNHQYLIASQSGDVRDNPIGFPTGWGCDAPPSEWVMVYDPNTGKKTKTFPCFDYATLADVLDAQNITWKYYAPPQGSSGYQWSAYNAINHVRNGSQWSSNVVNTSQFIADAANGSLPAVSWVVAEGQYSEHPPALMSAGESWTVQQLNAAMNGPDWPSTAVFITWDCLLYTSPSPRDS